MMFVYLVVACIAMSVSGFSPVSSFRCPHSLMKSRVPVNNGARSMTAIMDTIAGIALAAQLNSGNVNPTFMTRSMPLSVVETKQGMYKDYEVDKVDDSALDEIRKGYKTAEETDDGKTKYWAIFAVLVAGSFIIPMAQYYWYVAEED
mmetsp:Transcript_19353/g.18690  ORF Transcript_19353/g.18690 Transcript_19353/m.18690 type:complete len:147 (+) Transcript_19353:103-543(+)